jgi:sulfite reductase alpha subunit-like flavoprotein
LAKGGYIYIAGSSKMAPCVLDALVTTLKEYCGLEENPAKEYINKLQRLKRVVVEAWS